MGLSDRGGAWGFLGAAFVHRKEQAMAKKQYKVLARRIDYVQNRKAVRRFQGDIVEIDDHDVVRTFLGSQAVEEHVQVEEAAPEESGATGSPWDQIPGVSKAALAVLVKSELDPANVTLEQLVQALGSEARAANVVKALEKFAAAAG